MFNVTVVVFDLGTNPLIDDMRQAGASVIHLSVARPYTPKAMIQAWRLFHLIRERQIDIVQTFHSKADTYGVIIARMAGVRHILSSKRDTGELKTRPYIFVSRRIRSLVERVIVVADGVGDAMVEREGVDREDIVRIYNGVDVEVFRPPSATDAACAREALGFGDGDFVVGMVANFRPEKNHDVLFAGALEARRQIPELKLLLVGGGPLFERYKAQYGRSPSGIDAVFAGPIQHVLRHLYAMDVACLIPGANEGFSNAVLEKMATGLPLVVSHIGGNSEAVINGRNGIVIPPNDPGALARALIAMHADPVRRRAMGRESRRLVEEQFSLDRMWRIYEELYRSLCNGSARPAKLMGIAG
jgi:glycosyltransferase involved in cell wall biosynthesis